MHDTPPEPPPEQPPSKRHPSPYVVKHDAEPIYREIHFPETFVAETSEEEEYFDPRSQVSNAQEDTSASELNRYTRQARSSNGKLAYVVFAGRDVGVFYNWTSTALAIAGLDFSSRIFKGYTTYEAAHSAWEGFQGTGRLPFDVASGLGTRTYPTPPPIPSPPRTPQRRVLAYSIPMPFTPNSGHTLTNTLKPAASPSAASPSAASPSIPRPSTSTRNVMSEEALRADNDDFWVVLTGSDPGVHQGRQAGEKAFGQFANPSFFRTNSREEANQIFVKSYMRHCVARHAS